jgi:hypothetical protein
LVYASTDRQRFSQQIYLCLNRQVCCHSRCLRQRTKSVVTIDLSVKATDESVRRIVFWLIAAQTKFYDGTTDFFFPCTMEVTPCIETLKIVNNNKFRLETVFVWFFQLFRNNFITFFHVFITIVICGFCCMDDFHNFLSI